MSKPTVVRIMRMYKAGYSIAEIADVEKYSYQTIVSVIEGQIPALKGIVK
jgi:transposase-like protein